MSHLLRVLNFIFVSLTRIQLPHGIWRISVLFRSRAKCLSLSKTGCYVWAHFRFSQVQEVIYFENLITWIRRPASTHDLLQCNYIPSTVIGQIQFTVTLWKPKTEGFTIHQRDRKLFRSLFQNVRVEFWDTRDSLGDSERLWKHKPWPQLLTYRNVHSCN